MSTENLQGNKKTFSEKQRKEIGERFREVRISLGFKSAGAFAKSIKFSQPYFSEIETGKKSPSDRILTAIEQRYGIVPQWIETGQEPKRFDDQDLTCNPKLQGAPSVTESKIQLLLEQARYVLASGPEKYAQALSHVIVGFLGAVDAEEDRRECRTQLGELTEKEAIESTAPKIARDPK